MKILLLGRDGQVGWELARALSPLGDLTITGRGELDFASPGTVGRAVSDAAPDLVVNAVAYTAVDKAESEPALAQAINADAVGAIGQAAARLGATVIHYSTDYVFDGALDRPYREDDPTGPLNEYGRSKLAGERALAASGCAYLVFRTSWVHAGRRSNFIATMLRLAAERERLTVVADQTGAPTSAELIADVTALAVSRMGRDDRLASGIYHLAAGGETSWYDFARFIVTEAATLPGPALRVTPDTVVPVSTSEYKTAAARPRNSRLDTTRLRAALGLVLPDWRFHARRSIAELRERQGT